MLGRGPRFKPIWITGHSLGGALAVLAAARLDRAKVPVRGTITLGQPRVGDRAFVRAYPDPERLYRITNRGDPVTVVPLRLQLRLLRRINKLCPFSYQHVGLARELRQTSGGAVVSVVVDPVARHARRAGESRLQRAARSVKMFFRRAGSVFTLERHMLPVYLQNIWTQLADAVRGKLTARVQRLLSKRP